MAPRLCRLLNLGRQGVAFAAGDEARAALEGDVAPQPGQRDDDAVAQPDEEVDVGDAPPYRNICL